MFDKNGFQLTEQTSNHETEQQIKYKFDNVNLVQSQFQQQSMNSMDKFDVDLIYSNKNISSQNKYGSDFYFILPINKRGNKHLFGIQKSHIIWIIVKLICISLLCYFLYNWVNKFDNVYPIVKSSFLWSFMAVPFMFLLVMVIDPGYVLDHQIYQTQYEKTDDKKRPKQGKYCQYCRIFIKRKTNHCFRCNHCVSGFDHHCGILTRCVGKTNLILFYGFVLFANALYVGMVILVFYQFVIA